METIDSLLNPSENLESQQNDKANNDNDIIEKEKQRFTKHSALVTLLIMSIGPFSLVVQAIGEVVDMFMITKRFKNEKNSHAIEILGFTGNIGGILGYLGLYFGQALTTRISSLLGSGDRLNASHLFSDILYVTILVSFIFVAAFVFAVRPFLTFLGVPDYMLNDTFKYLIPSLVALPLTNISTITLYFFQSIGNSSIMFVVKAIAYILQLGIFSPLFLFGIKVSTTFMKLGSIVAGSIVGICVTILIYLGKFSLKPHFNDVLDKFCPELKTSLLYAAPLILSFFVFAIPPILILQSMTSVDSTESEAIGGVFAVYTQISTVNQAIPGAFGQSFLSAGTHAWGSNNPKRLVRLFLWTFLFNGSLTLLVSLVAIPGKSFICRSFLNDQVEIDLGEKMFPIPFYTSLVQGVNITISILMIVVEKPLFSFLPQIIQMIILCVGSKILASKFKNDISKVMYIYNISDLAGFLLYICFIFIPIREIKRKMKESTPQVQYT